ncbi:hypothetical protein BDZ94DRAFT_1310979 [Collybia nuda]|uniref:Uncharacterized protein n=1 Tax=Collybia nuda TaxID=64659 RepID=A0A9P5Y2D3_9AGAR|nr:hypothetical protein BDZ94DRAFT_1310979 [Collybia nuda]
MAGSLTITLVLVSWDAIGSVSTACGLISAAIKTCRVAQYMCNKRGIQSDSYMSDAYLDCIIDKLPDLVVNHFPKTQATPQQTEASTSTSNSQPIIPVSTPTENPKYKALQVIHMEDLQAWARDNKIKVLQWNPKKSDLINVILALTHIPSDDAICLIVNKQKGKKGAPVL